jgi:predicted nucleic acid-binding Zn ribbon protein
MATHSEIATDQEQSERAPLVKPGAPVVASPRACEVCAAPLTGRPQQKCCSARCRAAWSRRRRAEALAERDQRLRALLEGALRVVGAERQSETGGA